MVFHDRHDAGRRLAKRLRYLADDEPVVLALPRGGVPVAHEVATALGAPLDVLVVRKLGLPHQPELAVGAVGEDGVQVLNESVVRSTGLDADEIQTIADRERAVVAERLTRYRGDHEPVPLEGRTVIVVDDGLATGATARAGLAVLARRGVRRLVLAVPLAPAGTLARLGEEADEVVCLETPGAFRAIGEFYADFTQTSDEEVARLLADARDRG